MEVLIVGPGSLGQVYAAAFARAGVQVLLLSRPARLQRLYQQGIRLQGALAGQWSVSSWPNESAGPQPTIVASDRLPGGFHPDLTLFTTKGHQLDDAASVLQGAPLQWIVGLQNGISKDERLAGFFGAQRVVGGATTIAAERTAGGEVLVAVTGTTWLGPRSAQGAAGKEAAPLLQKAVTMLQKGGLGAEYSTAIERAEWSKAANAAAFFGVSTLTRTPWSDAWTDPPLLRAALSLVREVAAVAEAYGTPVDDFTGMPIGRYLRQSEEETISNFAHMAQRRDPNLPPMRVSMLQDLLAGRPMEVEPVFGDLLAKAEAAQVETPRLRFVYHVLSGLNQKLMAQV